MNNAEAVNWLINITADIGKIEHQDLWHYEQALSEIREMLETEPQRMRGKWINEGIYGEGHSQCSIRCSNPLCNFHYIGYLDDYNYCPNCGAMMNGE